MRQNIIGTKFLREESYIPILCDKANIKINTTAVFSSVTNISLVDSTFFFMDTCCIDCYDCHLEAHWEIQRADGETEIYTVLNETNHDHHEELPGRGLYIAGYCDYTYLVVSPTDLHYDGAQITAILDLPQCYNSFNVTESITLNIQGIGMYSYIIIILIFKFWHSDES